MDYVDSLLELVGNTPLVRLRSVTAGLAPTVVNLFYSAARTG